MIQAHPETPAAAAVLHVAVERLLVHASREVQVLSVLTPVNAAEERARLVREVSAGRAAIPAWSYAPVAHDELRRVLEAAERALDDGGAALGALGAAYRARVRELSLEASLCAAAGTGAVGPLARARYAPAEGRTGDDAAALCSSWLTARATPPDGAPIASDAADPRSLLSRLQAEVGRNRLPFRVVVRPSLAPLAATGDGIILVAAGRPTTPADVERTVLHEIEGHALPRARARHATLPLLRVGTARGVDDQEGLALHLEDVAGCMDATRRRALAARHRTVGLMRRGAPFTDAVQSLVRDDDVHPEAAVIVAERVYRGGDGVGEGLGRERVYVESFLRVRRHLAAHPEDAAVLASGQVAVDAVDVVRPYVTAAHAAS